MESQWTNILWRVAKGDAVQYRELNRMDTFEFFYVLEANKKLING